MQLNCYVYANLNIEKNNLDEKVEDLLKIVYKFTNGKKNVNMMFNILI